MSKSISSIVEVMMVCFYAPQCSIVQQRFQTVLLVQLPSRTFISYFMSSVADYGLHITWQTMTHPQTGDMLSSKTYNFFSLLELCRQIDLPLSNAGEPISSCWETYIADIPNTFSYISACIISNNVLCALKSSQVSCSQKTKKTTEGTD